jgi:hypothetical protein
VSAASDGAPPCFVEKLDHADDAVAVEERRAQDALRHVADALRDVGREAWIAARIRDRHRLAAHGDESGDPVAEGHSERLHLLRLRSQRHLEDELLLPLVEQEERRRSRGDDAPPGLFPGRYLF